MIFLRPFFFALGLALTVLAFAFPASAKEMSPLRHFLWGAAPEDVREFETATFYNKGETSEYYVEPLDGYRRTIRYDFRDGKLWRGYYGYNDLHHPDPLEIMRRAADFEFALEQIYGKPTTDELVWKRNEYRDDSRWLAAAMRAGDVKVRVTWTLPATRVVMESYHNGDYYELYYTAEKYDPSKDTDQNRNILNLPQTQKTKP